MRVVTAGVAAVVLVVLVLGRGVKGAARLEDADFVDERVASGFQLATDLCVLPSDSGVRFMVLEKAGKVKLVEDGVVQDQLVVDLGDRINSYVDRGLLGCAVDTAFDAGSRFIYLAYASEPGNAHDGPKSGQVARFTMNSKATKVTSNSEKLLLGTVTVPGCDGVDLHSDVVCCDGIGHCMGGMHFTDEGHLLIASGDGANSQSPDDWGMRAQNKHSLNGKVLRVDRDGAGVPSNPFYGEAGSKWDNVAKVMMLGLRNPWRLSYDSKLDKLWISDVSWGNWEEVDLGFDEGLNFGWPCWMGSQAVSAWAHYDECQNYPLVGQDTLPVYSFHRKQAQAIAGAARVNVADWPSKYRNVIFTADYTSSSIRYFEVDGSGNKKGAADDVPELFAEKLEGPVRIMESPAGDALWYLSILSQELRQIRYAPDTSAPTVTVQNPPHGATRIEQTAHVELRFSKRMDGASVAAAFTLYNEATGTEVPVSSDYQVETNVARFTPLGQLEAQTYYSLRLDTGATDSSGIALESDHASRFKTGSSSTVYVSDLAFVAEENAWGPAERDMAAGSKDAGDGGPISLRGVRFDRGLGVVAYSRVAVDVPEGCTRFQSTVGVDDSATDLEGGFVHFEVVADGTTIYDSADRHPEPLTRADPALDVDLDVTGTGLLSLVVHKMQPEVRNSRVRSSWAGARFRCGKFDDQGPKVVSALPADGDGDVPSTSPSIVVKFSEAMDVPSLAAGLRLRKGGVEIGFTPTCSADGTEVTLDVGQLDLGETYTIAVGDLATDLVGNPMRGTFESSFTTEARLPGSETTLYLNDLEVKSLSGTGSWDGSQSPVYILRKGKTLEFNRGVSMDAATSPRVTFTAPDGARKIRGYLGVDASTPSGGCIMKLFVDGVSVVSEKLVGSDQPVFIDVPLAEGAELRLQSKPNGAVPGMCNYADLKVRMAGGGNTHISDLTPVKESGTVSYDENTAGGKIQLTEGDGVAEDVSFERGFVAESVVKAQFSVPLACSHFRADVGVASGSGPKASVELVVKSARNGVCTSSVLTTSNRQEALACPIDLDASVTLQVTHSGDGRADDKMIIGNPRFTGCLLQRPPPRCEIAPLRENFKVGQTIKFRGKGLDYRGEALQEKAMSWEVRQHHCPGNEACHFHPHFTFSGVAGGEFKVKDHGDYIYYEVVCKVCDGDVCSTSSANSYPLTAEVTVDSAPSRLVGGVDSLNGQFPLTHRVVVGATVSLSALDSQPPYTFKQWQHNGDRTPVTSVKIKDEYPQTFVAEFES